MPAPELIATLEAFEDQVAAFARKTVVEEYDERIHDAKDAHGNVYKDANSRKTLVQGEEAILGHIHQILERQVVPLLDQLEGEAGG